MNRNEKSSPEEIKSKWRRRLSAVSGKIKFKWKRWLVVISVALLSLYVLSLIVGIALTHFLVDLWWFSSLDYGAYFWLRLLYRYLLSGAITVIFFLSFFLNFSVASRYLGIEASQFSSKYRRPLHLLQTRSLIVYTPLSLILAIVIALPFYHEWEAALFFLFGPDAAIRDPVYNNDVNFYLFSYPFYRLIQSELLIILLILTLSTLLLYWVTHHFIPVQKKEWPIGAKIHLTSLFLLTALIQVWGHMLERYSLLYVDNHEPLFFGPGFIEIRYQLPLIWISIALFLGVALCAALLVHARRGLTSLVLLGLLYGLTLGLRDIPAIPAALDRFIVKPNPVRTEKQFIENNIKATLTAYDLNQVREVEVTAANDHVEILQSDIRPTLHNIPVWDTGVLLDVYQHLQELRPYYSFPSVDVARYQVNDRTEQVNLAAREVNIAKLPVEARNWENTHLRYIHGYGAVITPANQNAEAPMRWWLRDLNLRSAVGFTIEKPDIYYGIEDFQYAIAPNKLKVVGLSRFESNEGYTGGTGIPISSLFRKLIFAVHFKDEKLFFTPNIATNSRMLIRRNIVERIKTLTPYLSLDADPYIVVTPEKIYWVQDAYTTSPWYPASKYSTFTFEGDTEETRFNYIRNSVKVVVDAYDGSVDYYLADPRDPIIQAYEQIYPGVFRDLREMPPRLLEQLRYPKDIFSIQMQIYAKYHQTDPALFYQQAETWDFASFPDKTTVEPYYLTIGLEPCMDVQNFVLVNPMTPIGRDNLNAVAIAGAFNFEECVSAYPGQLIIYKYRKEAQVEGPTQISALIDQDPAIARQMALWDLGGSRVQRGRIIILPIGRSVLYVQPVYLASATATKIPELKRVILSLGRHVVMESSLEKAFATLERKLVAH